MALAIGLAAFIAFYLVMLVVADRCCRQPIREMTDLRDAVRRNRQRSGVREQIESLKMMKKQEVAEAGQTGD
jgi:hypothetical protein